MSLQERLDKEVKEAMIAKDADKLSTLRFLKSALKYTAIDKKAEALTDAEIQQVIQKQIKQRRESIQQFKDGGRTELAAKEEKELVVLESYLPRQLSGEELENQISEVVREVGATSKKDFGRVMKLLTEKLTGQDAKRISEIVGKLLQ